MVFVDRSDAGRQLAAVLAALSIEDPVVLGLPRGGVVVAAEVAAKLSAPLDVIVVRKLGVPFEPELAFGAIGEGDAVVVDDRIVRQAGITGDALATIERRERAELERRSLAFRAVRPRVRIDGREVIIVDDGVATGSTARVACQVARASGVRAVTLAAPVAPVGSELSFEDVADRTAFVSTPAHLFAIGQWYQDFAPTSDETVVELLSRAAGPA